MPVDAAASGTHFKYPYSDLMLWAILLRRYKMTIFMWEHGEEALAKVCALIVLLLQGAAPRNRSIQGRFVVTAANATAQGTKEYACSLDLPRRVL